MRRCWRRRGWPVALLASAALLAGCGGATKKDVIARANAICATSQRDTRAVAPPAGSSLSAFASYLQHVLPLIDRAASQIRALPRPKPAALLDRWIASVQLSDADFHALENAARMGNREAFETALAALRSSRNTTLAASYGMRICAASGGTVAG
jgi:hypothetical protein